MRYTWFMFLVLTVAGGLIAFMGDRLGRYMGKRRMTIFGMRPRKTALCFTVVAGMLISLISLGVMSSISKPVRIALFEVDDLQSRQTRLEDDQRKLAERNRSLCRESDRLRLDYERTRQRVDAVSREEKRSRERLARTRSHLARTRVEAQRRIAGLRREVREHARLAAAKSRRIHTLGSQLDGVQGNLDRASGRLREARKNYEQAKGAFETVSTFYEQVSAQKVSAQEELAKAEDRLARLREEVQAKGQQADRAESQVAILQKARDELDTQCVELEKQIKSLKAEQTELTDAARVAQAKATDALRWARSQRVSTLIYVRGQELAWEVFDGRESQARIRERLLAMVERARSAAVGQGAGPEEGPEVALVPVRFVEQSGQRAPEVLQGPQALDAATEEISRANTTVVVQLKAATNTVAGDPVVSEIQVWVNRLVFHEGEPVARKVLNARQPVGRIVEELVALLHSEVRSTAVARGMIPRPSAADGIAPAMQVGEVPLSDVVATAERVRKQRGSAAVEVVAATDLWAADSMKVAFRVSPGTPAPDKGRSGGILTGR